MKTKILADFHICISVPLSNATIFFFYNNNNDNNNNNNNNNNLSSSSFERFQQFSRDFFVSFLCWLRNKFLLY